MLIATGVLVALSLLGSINAAVLKPNSLERRSTQSCHATSHGWYVSYSVLIRVPFGGKSDCDATFKAIHGGRKFTSEQSLEWDPVLISNWQCVESNGNIQLWFNSPDDQSSNINTALSSCYPTVDNFNCPDY